MPLTHAKAITFVLTPDHNRAAPWYQDVLGLKQVSSDPFAAVFDLAGTTLRLTTVQGWTAGAHTVLGWDVPDIRAAMAALKAKGVEFLVYPGFGQDADGVWSNPGGGAKICWFNDPDGNNLSLTELG
jgi:catechol 2,3-dioxygenase-like lactoylglutathione lyase family enzyme